MRILRTIGYAFMALVLAGGWAFIYWQSGSGMLSAVDATRLALADLRAVDAGWNQQLVNTRIVAGAAGTIVPAPGSAAPAPAAFLRPERGPYRYHQAYAALESRLLALGIPGAGAELTKLRRSFEQKEALLDRYAAVLDERSDALRAEPVDPARLAELNARAEATFGQAWLAETGPRLNSLGRAVDGVSDRALGEAELYRLALLYYSGFLLAVLVFLTWNLAERGRQIDRINSQLRDANETLEARVVERTSELSDTLAKLKESEAMLIQSEKMSSLGQMVAGIAHEVNTPLAYVKSSLNAVAKSVPESGRLADQTRRLLALLSAEGVDETELATQFATVQAMVDQLNANAGGRNAFEELQHLVKDGLFGIEQISEVIANLKDFSRLDRSKAAAYDLREGIESAIRIGHAQLQNRVVQKNFAEIPLVTCSPSQINQVILNLLSNAAQATSDADGKITVTTGMRDAEHVVVAVADNGSGIPADILPKIFDPFFTTKQVGKGTGLGLSICYKIVENHGGKLEVQSTPGLGTRFSLILPVNPPSTAEA